MAKGSTFSNDLLKLVFCGTAIVNMCDNAASAPLISLYVAIHTADPTVSGMQNSNECTYTGYLRVAVPRTTGGFTVATNTVKPVANISFPIGSGGSGTATHFSIGVASSGASKILYTSAISPTLVTGAGISPILLSTSILTET